MSRYQQTLHRSMHAFLSTHFAPAMVASLLHTKLANTIEFMSHGDTDNQFAPFVSSQDIAQIGAVWHHPKLFWYITTFATTVVLQTICQNANILIGSELCNRLVKDFATESTINDVVHLLTELYEFAGDVTPYNVQHAELVFARVVTMTGTTFPDSLCCENTING